MNATKQPLAENDAKRIDGAPGQTTPSIEPLRSSLLTVLRRYWLLDIAIFLLFLGIIDIIHHQVKSESKLALLQKGEGFGIAMCAVACCVIFVWRLARFFAKDEQRTKMSEEMKISTYTQKPPQNTPHRLT